MWDNRMANEVERVGKLEPGHAPDRLQDEEAPPSVSINPHSELGKELRKWEQHFGYLTPPGTRPGNPYVFREFPKMLYRAERHYKTGQATCLMAPPHPYEFYHITDRELRAAAYEDACQQTEQWNKAHQTVVGDTSGELIAKGQGWANSAKDALALYEQQQQDIAEAAAQTAFQARRMSDLAQRELATAEASTDAHVVDVQNSKKKRGRQPKAVTGTGPVE